MSSTSSNKHSQVITAQAWLLGEQLIETVARAFYSDPVIVVLDALIREKYIVEEELAPRLRFTPKEMRRVLHQLEDELLIRYENVPLDDETESFWKCYYIDYQQFANVIRYRIYCMQQAMQSQENSQLNDNFYSCPTCNAIYSSLEAVRLTSLDYKFICSHCCPYDNFRQQNAEKYFTLIAMDNRKEMNQIRSLEKKFQEQLSKQSDYHEGILELLAKLKAMTLPRNLPSINIKRGILSSAIEDETIAAEVEYNLKNPKRANYGGSYVKSKSKNNILQKDANPTNTSIFNAIARQVHSAATGASGISATREKPREFGITIHDTDSLNKRQQDSNSSSSNSNGYQMNNYTNNPIINTAVFAKRETAMPEFLKDSRVYRNQDVIKQTQSMQQDRLNFFGDSTTTGGEGSTSAVDDSVTIKNEMDNDPDSEQPNKRPRIDIDNSTTVVTTTTEEKKNAVLNEVIIQDTNGEEEVMDDVAWE